MKNKILLISQLLLLIIVNNLTAQTQGDQELKWAKDAFDNINQRREYPKFTGQIINTEGNTYKFNESFITVYRISDETKYLIENGIFYPSIVTENDYPPGIIRLNMKLNMKNKNKDEITSQQSKDSLIITDFECIESLCTITQKRLRLYLFRKGSINPQLCFIELTNKDATKEMTYKEFVKNCRVTFFEKGSILI